MPKPDLTPADQVRFAHILLAARQAMDFASGRTRLSLDTEPMFKRAVVSCIQEIGEAASRISPEGRAAAPEVPWAQECGIESFTCVSTLTVIWYGRCLSVTWIH